MKIRYNGEEGELAIIRFEDLDAMCWEERLRAEYWQTKIRLKKLKAYINKRIDGISSGKELIEILLMQENYMQGYLKCLEVRARYSNVDLGDKVNEGKQKAGQGMA